MTKVNIIYDGNEHLVGIECSGHAEYNDGNGGADIVCASVSTCAEILETAIRAVSFPGFSVCIRESQGKAEKSIRWDGYSPEANAVANAVASVLRGIAAQYPLNVSICESLQGIKEDKGSE